MNARESDYWDTVAETVITHNGISDNWLKREILNGMLLKCRWGGQKVLEIGVGGGATAAALAISCGRNWSYIGTDVSPKFCDAAKRFALEVVQADVLSLPPGPFTRIIALDSLEHVHPNDREKGYEEIAKRLEKGGLLFINMPLNRSLHDDKFDHGIDLLDLARLESEGLTLTKYDRYDIQYGNYSREYAFVVMTK